VEGSAPVLAAAGLLAGFLLPLAGLAATACILGRMAARWPLRLAFAGRLERWVVSAALGLALIAHLLLLLGFIGLLRPLPILLLAAGIHATGALAWRELAGDVRMGLPRWWGWIAIIAVLGVLPFLLLALYPPTAFDATLYHLPFARAFVRSGGVPYLLDRRVPVFPQANEILFAAVMLFGRDVAAQGVQLLSTLLAAALAAAWGRGAWPARRWVGWLAAAAFLGNPIVAHLSGSGYVEAGLALFVTAGLFALDRWRGGGGRSWLALAAVFLATACDVKYLGLFFAGIGGLTVLLAGGRPRPAAARLRDGALFAAVCAAFLAPWYLRIVAFDGNPLFPYLPRVFGPSPWNPTVVPEAAEGLAHRLERWARLPWDLVFRRRAYNQEPPFSPVYLAALPLLALAAARDLRLRLLLLLILAYGLVFTALPADGRYLVPILPAASLAAAGALATVWRGRSRAAVAALCLAVFLPGWLYAGYRIGRQGPVPVTAGERDAYLARELPVYPAIAWLNRTRGSAYTVWALHAENMTYFADGRFLGDWFGPAGFFFVLRDLHTPAELHGRLRRLDAGHLLVTVRNEGLPFPEDPDFRRWFAPVYADPAARVYELRDDPRGSESVRSR
jgi:hypothetical protein